MFRRFKKILFASHLLFLPIRFVQERGVFHAAAEAGVCVRDANSAGNGKVHALFAHDGGNWRCHRAAIVYTAARRRGGQAADRGVDTASH